ncbi:SDR family NAD(P)-dependent oxidoreductase [Lapidilactobacillus bayanensis]|uniref:SDR family NAD(P)-dependent oxidoreductase n=1 Tax=Lapidilactobacillus bayanensis TaxID=2485998 RepID=UPI000F78A5F3|nr:SDR family NAD(P)-dependent oxidoreductase [Lapidilactobacillus bayanensis]
MSEITVIIGADQGLGAEIAHKFGREGQEVVLIARNQTKLAAVCQKLTREQIRSHYFTADISQLEQIDQLFATIAAEVGRPSNLIFNVGNTHLDDALSSNIDTIKSIFNLNVLSAIQSARSFVTYSDKQTKRAIIFTSGGAGIKPTNFASTLSLTKAALRSYVFTLHDELAAQSIFVGMITIAGIIGLTPDVTTSKLADVYWQLLQDQAAPEIIYPQSSSKSEFEQLQQLITHPEKIAALLQAHPEFKDKAKQLGLDV